eukprot:TRINITY_DN358_c0_g1_i9.p1 TRINITY_DN358_c0_g1~~TRINITY_DN358_c0_g1_i9.p1  ORF type:complete len:368 (-),score=63.30 TRINITY_DN358_c0_g1_i9:462-1565(-)
MDEAPTHKSMETQYVYNMHVAPCGKVDRITKVWHSAWAAAQVGWTPLTSVPVDAENLFHACESGRGWHEVRRFCTRDATFDAQAEPLKDIKTLHGYAEWMKGIATVAMPGSQYDLNSCAFDPKTHTATFFGTFRGTHTGHLEGFPEPTHKSMETQYVYCMHVAPCGKVDRITKVWHSAWAAAQVGWLRPALQGSPHSGVAHSNHIGEYYFTYGSLKRGFPNHAKHEEELSRFVGKATTVEPYPLIVPKEPSCTNPNCPYLHRQPTLMDKVGLGYYVKGEVYAVKADDVKELDVLEGFYGKKHSDNVYFRRHITVRLESGDEVVAHCYFIADHAKKWAELKEGTAECLPEYTSDMAVGELKPGWSGPA